MINFDNGKFICFEDKNDADFLLLDGRTITAPFPKFFMKTHIDGQIYESFTEISKDKFITHFQIWLEREQKQIENIQKKVGALK